VDRGLPARLPLRSIFLPVDITLAAFTPGPVDEAPVERLRPFCARVEVVSLSPARSKLNMVAAIPSKTPFQVAYFSSGTMMRVVKRLSRDGYDAVFAHYFRMAPYVEPFPRARVFMDLQDSLSRTRSGGSDRPLQPEARLPDGRDRVAPERRASSGPKTRVISRSTAAIARRLPRW
jgi:hypothetical protein